MKFYLISYLTRDTNFDFPAHNEVCLSEKTPEQWLLDQILPSFRSRISITNVIEVDENFMVEWGKAIIKRDGSHLKEKVFLSQM